MDFCKNKVNNQAKLDEKDLLTFGGVLGGGKRAFALPFSALSMSSRVIPDSSGGVDSTPGLILRSASKKT